MQNILHLEEKILQDIQSTDTLYDLEQIRIRYVGKKGEITKLIKKIHLLSTEEKITYGKNLNKTLKIINKHILEKKKENKYTIYI